MNDYNNQTNSHANAVANKELKNAGLKFAPPSGDNNAVLNGFEASPTLILPKFQTAGHRGPSNYILPKIAIKRSDNQSFNNASSELLLVNGRWDTSTRIPTIDAEIRSADLEEFRSLPTVSISSTSGRPAGNQANLKLIASPPLATDTNMSVGGAMPTATETPSPLGSDSGFEGDTTDGNLSWLLNYKINELPPVPEQLSQNSTQEAEEVKDPVNSEPIEYHPISEHGNYIDLPSKPYEPIAAIPEIVDNRFPIFPQSSSGSLPLYPLKAPPKKPPFTYTELIEHALIEKGELTVSGIYQWISDHFPYYKQNDDRWKNSVRHNLSINPHFRKGSKAVHGAGHLWTIAQRDDETSWQIKRQRMEQFIHSTINEFSTDNLQDIELATATASIMQLDNLEGFQPPPTKQPRLQPQNLAVEYVIDMSGGLGDFLYQPVSAEEIVEESGLGGSYFITDLNPATFGLNLSEPDLISGLFYEELNLQTYELHEIE